MTHYFYLIIFKKVAYKIYFKEKNNSNVYKYIEIDTCIYI